MQFLGNFEAKLDAKGRAFLPSTFRKVLQTTSVQHLVLRKDVFQECLVVYCDREWNRQIERLRSNLNRWNAQHQQVFRQFVSEAEIVTLDGNGRFLIPRRLLASCGISQDVRFIGMGDTIEIWDNGKTESPFMKPEEFGQQLQQLMENVPETAED